MHRSHLAVAALFFMVLSALAQEGTPEGECANRFKASDLNGDGVLTPTEIPKAAQLPPALAKEVLIARKQYVAECAKLVAAQMPQAPSNTGQTPSPEPKAEQAPQAQTPAGTQPAPAEPDAKK